VPNAITGPAPRLESDGQELILRMGRLMAVITAYSNIRNGKPNQIYSTLPCKHVRQTINMADTNTMRQAVNEGPGEEKSKWLLH